MPFKREIKFKARDSSEPQLLDGVIKGLVPGTSYKVGFIVFNSDFPYQRNNQRVLEYILSAIGNHDIVLAPEYAFAADETYGKPMTKEEKDTYLQAVVSASRGKNTLIVPGTFLWEDSDFVHNQTFAINDGKTLPYCKYNSQARDTKGTYNGVPCKESCQENEKPLVLTWNNLRTGIEICADYGLLQQFGEKSLDLRILLACGSRALPSPEIRGLKEKGALLYVEGGGSKCFAGICLTYD